MSNERSALNSRRRPGAALLAAGILANPWILGALFAPDGSIDGEARIRLVFLFDVFCTLAGLSLLWRRPSIWFGTFIPNPLARSAALACLAATIVGTWWG